MISCRYLEQCEISVWLPRLFSILHENMSAIAPTGNPYEEDYALWSGAVASALEQENRRIVLNLYANKKNTRSQCLLEHLGFSCIGENRNGNSYRYRGDCQSFFRHLREKRSNTF